MEALLLTCLQFKLFWSKVQLNKDLTPQIKNDLIYEIKLVTPKKCLLDAKAD
jgi:hypothetical protein